MSLPRFAAASVTALINSAYSPDVLDHDDDAGDFCAHPIIPASKAFSSAPTPTVFLVSALFSVSADTDAAAAAIEIGLPVGGRPGWHLVYKGVPLGQAHLSVLLRLLQALRGCNVDAHVRLVQRDVLERLGWSRTPHNCERLRTVLKQLFEAKLEYRKVDDDRWLGGMRLLNHVKPLSARSDGETTAWDVRLDVDFSHHMRTYTLVDLRQRKQLNRNRLALWLHGFISANDCTRPYAFRELKQLSGDKTVKVRDFKDRCLTAAAKACGAGGWSASRVRGGLWFCKKRTC